jgi:hypothetical protein
MLSLVVLALQVPGLLLVLAQLELALLKLELRPECLQQEPEPERQQELERLERVPLLVLVLPQELKRLLEPELPQQGKAPQQKKEALVG